MSFKKNYIKVMLELFGLELFFGLISDVFFMNYFYWLNPKIYSVFTAWLMLWAMHSALWQLGNKDRKRIKIENNHLKDGEKPHKQKMYMGALIALPFFAVNLIFVLVTCISNLDSLIFVHTLVHFTFVGFISSPDYSGFNADYLISSICVCLVMYIPCITAYISGAHNFSLIEKYVPRIIYKPRVQDENTEE